MIDNHTFTKDWIYSHRQRIGLEKVDPPILEKMIHALVLVERLVASDLSFVFKGGTSLILLLPAAGRFSIDIDIITEASREQIESALTQICQQPPFTRFQLSAHRSYKDDIPKAHYKLEFTSQIDGKVQHILLDILLEKHTYPVVQSMPIVCDWIATSDPAIQVTVPSHESITGDKLTAFAPNTTGILYGQGKELEIVKQLFDLGRLFHTVTNIETVRIAFDQTVIKEITYRGRTCSREDVLQDIIQTGLLIARKDLNKTDDDAAHYKEIQKGLEQFKAYRMSYFFRLDDAVIAAAKAAYMAAAIQATVTGTLETFDSSLPKSDLLITHPDYLFLNKLPAEPLFYWNRTLRLLGRDISQHE